MATKAYQRFHARIASFDCDLELVDLLLRRFHSSPNSDQSVGEAFDGRQETHPNLFGRGNSRKSRDIVGGHLKRTLYIGFIKELYEDFAEYMATSVSRAALAGVDAPRFVGQVKLDIQAADILGAGSWEAAVGLISDKIFRALENEKKTKDLITKIDARLGLQLDAAFMDAAMPYLDARHIFVHRDGKPDDLYTRTYAQIVVHNGKIQVNYEFVQRARAAVLALAVHIDEKLIAANLVRPQDLGPRPRPGA